jgi:hypothetical protein
MKTIAEFIWHLASTAAGIAVLLTAGIVIYAEIMALVSKDRDVLMRTTM